MFTQNVIDTERTIHVRFGGRSFDVSLSSVRISSVSSDREIKSALSRHLDLNGPELRDYVVDRHRNGNLTVRPQAVFG
jgi:hypothetical protein